MGIDVLIPTIINHTLEKNLKNELVLDKLSGTKYTNKIINFGDEEDVVMPAEVTMNDWDGGDLVEPEKATESIIKVKVDRGKQINFEVEKAKVDQIEKADNDEARRLAEEYSKSATDQFAEAIDRDIGKLYVGAGYTLNNGEEVPIDKETALPALSLMKAIFSRGKAWVDGKMGAFLPPEYIAILNQIPNLLNTESGKKEVEKGFVGFLAGWKIYESNNLYSEVFIDNVVSYPLFGVLGETTASVKQSKIDLIPYMREKSVNKAFKGTGVFGTGLVRPDKLRTINANIGISFK
jgi:hypothetical protein